MLLDLSLTPGPTQEKPTRSTRQNWHQKWRMDGLRVVSILRLFRYTTNLQNTVVILETNSREFSRSVHCNMVSARDSWNSHVPRPLRYWPMVHPNDCTSCTGSCDFWPSPGSEVARCVSGRGRGDHVVLVAPQAQISRMELVMKATMACNIMQKFMPPLNIWSVIA